jgi:hypothetical protein
MNIKEKLKAIDVKYNHICVGNDDCALCDAIDEITDLENRLDSITKVIFASGACLGSDNYFEIRKLALYKRE